MITNSVVVANNYTPQDVCANHYSTIVECLFRLYISRFAKFFIGIPQRNIRIVISYKAYPIPNSNVRIKSRNLLQEIAQGNKSLLQNFIAFSKFRKPTHVTTRMQFGIPLNVILLYMVFF